MMAEAARFGDEEQQDHVARAWLAEREPVQVLFGWDGDHLHVFEAGKKRYGDPFVNLEGTGDEEAVRVRDAVAAGGTIAYTYDLGAGWEQEITLETTVPRDH